ncbi:MAG: hypothetical protein E8D46_14295 [Nitrospira sp.]|nr:MAG: hypothetical protein E8D46_14295 [Nitrospira sp.]
MTIVRFTVCVLVLFVALFDIRPLWAHEGHIHVVTGIVTAMNDSRLIVNSIDGRTVTIQLDYSTRYCATGEATSRAIVEIGDRVVVDVTEETDGLYAADVRYQAVAPKTP